MRMLIQRRLTMVILMTSLAVLALTSLSFASYELIVSSQELARNVHTTARIIGDQAAPALASHSEADARDVLASLRSSDNILAGALYDNRGTLFASYPTNAPPSRFPAKPPASHRVLTRTKLVWTEPVVYLQSRVGTLWLQSNLGQLYERLHLYALIGIIITAVSFLLAFFLARHLQKGISRPILQLAETARVISEGRDYTVRAHKFSDDELGLLTDAFNHMLGQIKDREAALEQNAQRLRLALQAGQIGTWDWHIQIDRVDWDELVYRHFGLEKAQGDPTFEGFLRGIHPQDRAPVNRAVAEALEKHQELEAEFRVRWPDGSIHHLVTRGKALYDEQGRAVRMSGVSLDITERKKAEEAHAFIAAIVESSDDAVIGKDLQGVVVSWNHGAEQMFGYSKEEIVGRPVQMLTSPDRPDEEEQILARIRAGSPVEHYETVRIGKGDRPVQVALSVSPIRDTKGMIIGISSIARDITERKKAEEVLARQAAVLREQAQLLDLANVLARDLDDRIILWSAGTEQMYGWTRAEALGKKSHDLLATQFSDPYPQIIGAVLRKGEWTGELVHKRRNGDTIMVASHWVLYRDDHGQPTAILEINNDITQRKSAEEEIRRLNAELEQRVRERTAELTEANRELEAFTYSVSHDLRAPLRHIDAFARIVEEEMTAEAGPELRNYIGRIRKGTQTMGRLVDDLLNLSRVGRAQLGWQTVELGSLLDEVLMDLRAETAGRRIEWRIGNLPAAECDPGLMKQVFANLLSNAVKYTRPRETAIIEVGQQTVGGEIVIYVRDNGVGFDMKYIHKLFGVFERLHRPEEFEGTGIGLAIVRRIIQKHGGRVWAEAESGKGATFYFTFQGLARQNESLPNAANPLPSHPQPV